MYAKTFFEIFNFDAVTLSPYMGKDSSLPYLEFDDKWIILLALTSNNSSVDIQYFKDSDSKNLYEHVLSDSLSWSSKENTMYVVGANRMDELASIRKIIPDNFLLIPGVGTQGGDLKRISLNSMNDKCGIIVNVTPLEPGWEGHVTLEFSNTTPLPAKIYANEGVAQFIFLKGNEKPNVTYADRKGKYMKQEGVTLPKL